MISLFTFLAMMADYGHLQFPNSPLNWWVAIFTLIASLCCIMQVIQFYDDIYTSAPNHILIANLKAILRDLSLTLALTLGYSLIL